MCELFSLFLVKLLLHVAAFPFFIFLYIPDKVDFTPVTIPDILADDMRRSLILELVGPKLKSSNKLYAMFVIPEPFDFDKTPFPPAKPLAKPKVVSIPNSNQCLRRQPDLQFFIRFQTNDCCCKISCAISNQTLFIVT